MKYGKYGNEINTIYDPNGDSKKSANRKPSNS